MYLIEYRDISIDLQHTLNHTISATQEVIMTIYHKKGDFFYFNLKKRHIPPVARSIRSVDALSITTVSGACR